MVDDFTNKSGSLKPSFITLSNFILFFERGGSGAIKPEKNVPKVGELRNGMRGDKVSFDGEVIRFFVEGL